MNFETDYSRLSHAQRRAIAMLIEAECAGVAISRLFRTPYSCRFCGRIQGQPGQARDRRKLMLVEHERTCQAEHPGPPPG